MRYRNLLLTCILVLLIMAVASVTTLANHYEYSNRDPALQIPTGLPPPAGDWPEHRSHNKWYIYSPYYPHDASSPIYSVVWRADSTNMQTAFQTALNSWTTALASYGIDWVIFKDVTANPAGYVIDLEVYGQFCPTGALGCVGVTQWQGATPSNANRPLKSVLYLRYIGDRSLGVDIPWANQNMRVGGIAHEVGHLINLAERYQHTPACNGGENTIMDGTYASGGNLYTCDNISGPTNTDKARIEVEYTKGTCPSSQAPQQSGNDLLSYWTDFAYENWSHNLQFYKRNGGGTYDWKGIGDESSLVGTEYGTVQRVTINTRVNVKGAWGTGTYYVSCRPRFGATNGGTNIFGLTSDSPTVNIN